MSSRFCAWEFDKPIRDLEIEVDELKSLLDQISAALDRGAYVPQRDCPVSPYSLLEEYWERRDD